MAALILVQHRHLVSPWPAGAAFPRPQFLAGDLPLPAAYLGVPLASGERVIGVLLAGSPVASAYGADEVRLRTAMERALGEKWATARADIAWASGAEGAQGAMCGGEPMTYRVLIADDDPSLRLLISTTLEDDGVDLLQANDGQQALALARSLRLDLILLDLAMPGLTGVEVCRALKADPTLARSPVIVLTAHSRESDRRECLAAGARAFLSKPFSPLQLLHLVDELRLHEAPAVTRSLGLPWPGQAPVDHRGDSYA